ncbi:MAG TPA: DUF3237 domain-containing protein [Polyangia bacterium]|jgi:hypothetical protein|nr:DUF3237 domain-containing protein [Polyangia bacterium]
MSMMRFTNEQLTLWYGSADAPAPTDDAIEARRGVSVTVGVQPPSPSNVVSVQYRVDDGQPQTARGVRLATDHDRGIEYHRTVLPDFWTGERVSYVPVLSCAGRSAPDPDTAATLPSSFRLTDAPLSTARAERVATPPRAPTSDFPPPAPRFLASISVPLQQPEIIGETPTGLLVNWFWSPNEGTVVGFGETAKVRKNGGDWMNIRRDGIGVMNVRATVETAEGALIYAEYQGYCDFGANGYQNFLDRRWPELAPTRTTPRLHTTHPKYTWVNRLQCIGVGAVHMKRLLYTYDLYAL